MTITAERKIIFLCRSKLSREPRLASPALQIDGNHALSTADLLSVIGSTHGEPYSEAGVSSDRNNILAFYYNEGLSTGELPQ